MRSGRVARDIIDQIPGSASNILVLSEPFGGGKIQASAALFGLAPPEEVNALVVTINKSTERWLSAYQKVVETIPSRLAIIGAGEAMRSATSAHNRDGSRPSIPGEPVVDTVANPGDLTGLGIKITDHLARYEEHRYRAGPTRITFGFDSLTALLQYADLERVFRFLHVITARINSLNATAHYHIDPSAHQPQTIATLQSLFDTQLDATDHDPTNWHLR